MNEELQSDAGAEEKRILIVDDQVRDTRLLKLYLERTNDYVVRKENDAV